MADDIDRLLGILNIEKLEEDLFRGTGAGGETTRRIFGGQVIAQALRAAYQTVPDDRLCHSLHAYFIRPGDPDRPVIYEVDRARDGGSFTTRRVVAIQHGRQILNLSASFQIDEDGFEHHHPMPQDMPDPEGLTPRADRVAAIAARLPEQYRAEITRSSPIELREVDPRDPIEAPISPDASAIWIRLARPVTADLRLQHCLLAYTSDLYLLGTAMRPAGESFYTGRIMSASLDHALWLHRPMDLSDWHLYALDAPSASGARGMSRGQIFSRDGRLVASVAQEGLLRQIEPGIVRTP